MSIQLDAKLYGKMPMDLIRECIMPYAYCVQPPELMMQIRNFHKLYTFKELIDADWKEHRGKLFMRTDTQEIVGRIFAKYAKECLFFLYFGREIKMRISEFPADARFRECFP